MLKVPGRTKLGVMGIEMGIGRVGTDQGVGTGDGFFLSSVYKAFVGGFLALIPPVLAVIKGNGVKKGGGEWCLLSKAH